jgi:peptide deformylase
MAIREIIKMGDPRLLRVAQPIKEFNTPELHALLQDMQDTMAAANGAGLAAPQIGMDLQLVIFGSGRVNPRYPAAPPVPRTVLINPVLTAFNEENTPFPHDPRDKYAINLGAICADFGQIFDLKYTSADHLKQPDWEGCLSVPGLRGVVPRFKSIRYQGFDELGAPMDRRVDGFHARVVQHECDHLHGILYPMRLKDFSQFGFTEVLFPELSGQDDD